MRTDMLGELDRQLATAARAALDQDLLAALQFQMLRSGGDRGQAGQRHGGVTERPFGFPTIAVVIAIFAALSFGFHMSHGVADFQFIDAGAPSAALMLIWKSPGPAPGDPASGILPGPHFPVGAVLRRPATSTTIRWWFGYEVVLLTSQLL